ncbi:MAG: EcsC family protein [candidate division NC10 bacterium]|nr:EcsC family protein [candidate division NC10 bacterium]
MDDEYIRQAKLEIERWESQGPGFVSQVGDFILWPAQKAAELSIPEGLQEAVAKAIQGFLSGVGSATQLIINEGETRQKVETLLGEYRDELKAADAGAKHYWGWHVGYAAAEGGATGAAGLPGLVADIPLLFTISLRLIQQMGLCYGYDVTKEAEQEYVMHILRTGSTGDIKAKMEFLVGLKQIEQILLKVTWKKMNEAVACKEISRLSVLAAMRQFAKSLGIQLTKRKALQIVPVIGGLVGASFNAVFVNDVGRASYMSYRRRRITELEESS